MAKQQRAKSFKIGDVFNRAGQTLRIREVKGSLTNPLYVFQTKGYVSQDAGWLAPAWLPKKCDIKICHEDLLTHPFKLIKNAPIQLTLF